MGQNNHNPWDLNHDNKLSSSERAFRNHMLMTDFETRKSGGYSGSYKRRSNNYYNPDSISDNVMSILGSLILSVLCLVGGYKMATNEWGEFFDTLGGLVILAGIVFAIITFAYTFKLIGLLMKK